MSERPSDLRPGLPHPPTGPAPHLCRVHARGSVSHQPGTSRVSLAREVFAYFTGQLFTIAPRSRFRVRRFKGQGSRRPPSSFLPFQLFPPPLSPFHSIPLVASLHIFSSWAAQMHNLQSARCPFRATTPASRPPRHEPTMSNNRPSSPCLVASRSARPH